MEQWYYFKIGPLSAASPFLSACFSPHPMIMLMSVVAYRWMRYGGRAVMDDPATGQPLFARSEA